MRDQRSIPALSWTAFAAGLLAAVVGGLGLISVAVAANAPFLGLGAPIIGCAWGGFLAGKWAKHDGLYHGAFVGAGWVALEAFGLLPTVAGAGLATLEETIAIILSDLLLLAAASAGGFIATRS